MTSVLNFYLSNFHLSPSHSVGARVCAGFKKYGSESLELGN